LSPEQRKSKNFNATRPKSFACFNSSLRA